jgi:hypothetical protein
VAIDPDRAFTDAYAVRNVPTVLWVDEEDRIVRPADVAFGTDTFIDFHGIDSQPHFDALRRWVIDGEEPLTGDDEVREHVVAPTDDEQLARVHFRVGLELHRAGRTDAAARQFARAGELAPDDFTIRRAALPLQGIDPFVSEEFFALYGEWEARGKRGYGFSH